MVSRGEVGRIYDSETCDSLTMRSIGRSAAFEALPAEERAPLMA